jgi:N6-adenosine-specific RNA methylase IME4
MKQLQFHRLADLFPMMEGVAFDAFAADIKERGLLHPIVVHDDKILDGRNRYRACIKSNVAIRAEPFGGDDPLGFVIANNLHRRHLDESQRAMVAAKLATMKRGNQPNGSIDLLDQPRAAALLNVSVPSVKRAAVVRSNGTAALVRAVEQGAIPVSVAAKLAVLPKEQQREAVEEPERAKHLVKRTARDDRERNLATATVEASRTLGTKLYGVIYADPPWRFEPYSRDTGMDRAADNHYGTMTVEDICGLADRLPAAEDAVLFLWATVPMLPEALAVMSAWGFTYKSHFVWVKDRAGTGYWSRNKHEILLICTRGNIPAPAPGEQFASVVEAESGKHSAKPAVFAEMIEEMFPNAQSLEMFARGPRLGWDTWGNEA